MRISRSLFKWNYLKNQKYFLPFFSIYGIYIKFETFSRKGWSSDLIYFVNSKMSKPWLNHSLKSAVSEDPLTVNMFNGPKHLWNLHESTFIIFFPSLWGQIIWKMLLLLKFEMIGVFVNTWAADFKYPVPDCENLQFSFKCNYLKNKKLFMSILCHLWNLDQIWNIFKKMKIVIAQVFLKLKTVKDFVRSLTKKCRLITSLDSQHVEVSQILVRALLSYFSINLRRNDLGNIPSIWSLKS